MQPFPSFSFSVPRTGKPKKRRHDDSRRKKVERSDGKAGGDFHGKPPGAQRAASGRYEAKTAPHQPHQPHKTTPAAPQSSLPDYRLPPPSKPHTETPPPPSARDVSVQQLQQRISALQAEIDATPNSTKLWKSMLRLQTEKFRVLTTGTAQSLPAASSQAEMELRLSVYRRAFAESANGFSDCAFCLGYLRLLEKLSGFEEAHEMWLKCLSTVAEVRPGFAGEYCGFLFRSRNVFSEGFRGLLWRIRKLLALLESRGAGEVAQLVVLFRVADLYARTGYTELSHSLVWLLFWENYGGKGNCGLSELYMRKAQIECFRVAQQGRRRTQIWFCDPWSRNCGAAFNDGNSAGPEERFAVSPVAFPIPLAGLSPLEAEERLKEWLEEERKAEDAEEAEMGGIGAELPDPYRIPTSDEATLFSREFHSGAARLLLAVAVLRFAGVAFVHSGVLCAVPPADFAVFSFLEARHVFGKRDWKQRSAVRGVAAAPQHFEIVAQIIRLLITAPNCATPSVAEMAEVLVPLIGEVAEKLGNLGENLLKLEAEMFPESIPLRVWRLRHSWAEEGNTAVLFGRFQRLAAELSHGNCQSEAYWAVWAAFLRLCLNEEKLGVSKELLKRVFAQLLPDLEIGESVEAQNVAQLIGDECVQRLKAYTAPQECPKAETVLYVASLTDLWVFAQFTVAECGAADWGNRLITKETEWLADFGMRIRATELVAQLQAGNTEKFILEALESPMASLLPPETAEIYWDWLLSGVFVVSEASASLRHFRRIVGLVERCWREGNAEETPRMSLGIIERQLEYLAATREKHEDFTRFTTILKRVLSGYVHYVYVADLLTDSEPLAASVRVLRVWREVRRFVNPKTAKMVSEALNSLCLWDKGYHVNLRFAPQDCDVMRTVETLCTGDCFRLYSVPKFEAE